MSPESRPHFRFRAQTPPRRVLAVLLFGATFVGGCNPITNPAQFVNAEQAFYVHALTGAPLAFSTAVILPSKAFVRVDGSFSFDIAFDIDAQGNVVLLPASVVGVSPTGTHRVGIVKPGGLYDNALTAPTTGYVFDSVTVVGKNEPVIVRATEPACGLSLQPYMHARIVIDSLDVPNRAMWGRAVINTNCGLRSLVIGLPTS